jgi:hypothetical protein
MTVPRPARWPWIALAAFVLLAIVGTAGVVKNDEPVAEQVPFIIAFAMFGAVGALILSRAPGNRVGGLLLYASFTTALAFAAGELVTLLVSDGTTEGFLVVVAAYLSNFLWLLGILPVLFFVPLLFPDGRLPSPRWRPFGWVCSDSRSSSSADVREALLSGSSGERWYRTRSPSRRSEIRISDAITVGLAMPDRRGFCRWCRKPAARTGSNANRSSVVFAVVFLVARSSSRRSSSRPVGEEAFGPDHRGRLPVPSVSIGIARCSVPLYDLDVVVKKALVAGALAVVAIAVYAGVVGLYGLVAAEGESSFSVFAIALLLGLAFRPVTRIAHRIADRVVYGTRATPYEVHRVPERVGEAYATEDVLVRCVISRSVGRDLRARGCASAGVAVRSLLAADAPALSRWIEGDLPRPGRER